MNKHKRIIELTDIIEELTLQASEECNDTCDWYNNGPSYGEHAEEDKTFWELLDEAQNEIKQICNDILQTE